MVEKYPGVTTWKPEDGSFPGGTVVRPSIA
jgi:hypothetical protein